MYGKWLYKEIGTEYGACKVEIYRKNYTGESIEIGALAADSLTIALENLGNITDPIGKSVCSFSIIDTDQVEYDDFFTPDATALKVVVSTRVGSGAFVTRWSGYVTPDFFAENLSYRTPISISARDNIGYLNDVDFDLTATTITVREFIQSAFRRIAEDYPMSLSFVTQKQTAEGILAIDATISTTLLREMSWGEALETILHDLGLQMRWVDNNTIAVLDLSQIPEYYQTQGFNFIEASGYREIVPAWRELSQEQDYGLIENFFRGRISEEDLTFVKEEQVVISSYNTSTMKYYSPKNWLGNGLTINYNDYFFSVGGTMSESERNRIYFTGISKDTTAYIDKFMGWRQPVYKSNNAMKISFKALNSIQVVSQYSLPGMPFLQTFGPYSPGTAQFGLKVNVLLHTATKTYIMRYNWEELNADETDAINFVLPVLQGNAYEEECVIDIGNIPYDGELELRIYGWYFIEATNWTSMPLNAVSYITDVIYSYDTGGAITGRDAKVQVSELHNIKNDNDYSFGEVPLDCGGINAYAGGLFKADGNELAGFQRNANATNYNLLELVGRELIHFNKKNYNRLSGTIRNLNKEPLMFNRLFVREGKKYAPYNYSLNVISNEMNITSMQEVEQYETATFNTIDSQITTGGGTVSGGNNTILQYSEEAGNEKRLYELQTATEQEKNDAYVLVDKAGFPEARKVHISELGGFDVSELEQYLESNGYATLKRIWEVDSANAVVRTQYNVVSTQEIISGRRASGASSDVTGGGGISQVTAQMIADALGYVPYSSLNPAGYITSAALDGYAKMSDIPSLSGYATETWVEGKKYLTAIPSEYITETELSNTLGSYQTKITSSNKLAYSLISGTPTLATVATSGKYSDLSGTPSSLPASDVYAWAKKSSLAAADVPALDWSKITSGKPTTLAGYGITNAASVYNSGSYVSINASGRYIVHYGDDSDWRLTSKNWVAEYKILHSGNIDSYAVKYAGGASVDTARHSIGYDNSSQGSQNLPTAGGFISADQGAYGFQLLGAIWGTKLFFRGINNNSLSDWKTIAFTDSNVASATKLQTARTIWGQSFDGTGNVSGNISLFNDAISWLNDSSNYSIQIKDDGQAYYKAYYGHHFYTNGVERMHIVSGGHVLIGTAIDKAVGVLQVAGQVASYNSNADAGFRAIGSSYSLFFGIGSGNVNRGIYDDTKAKWWIFRDATTNTYIPDGNVLIGTTSDDGYKLNVDGTSRAKLYYAKGLYTYGSSWNSGAGGLNVAVPNDSGQTPLVVGYRTGTSPATAGVDRLFALELLDSGVQLRYSWGGAAKHVFSNNGNVEFTGNLIVAGEVISSRRATSSDARLKDNINRLLAEDCLAMVRNLQPSSWDWKNDGKHSLGFIAQDVEQYMPYAVTKIKDDKLGEKLNLQYDQFFAPVVGAIQYLDIKVDNHEDEIEGLKKRVKYLENKLQEYGYNRY